MKVTDSKVAVWVVCVGAILTGWRPATAQESSQHSREQAQKLWEEAISAKGGRDRLHGVSSLLMWYEETTRNCLGMALHRGHVETLYVFPGKVWSWDDGLAPPFRLTVGVLDLDRDFSCRVSAESKSPTCGNARKLGSREGIDQAQYLYLMETKWVKPSPISVRKDRVGLKPVDVLETQLEDKRILYFLDRKTHLPKRVAVFHGTSKLARVSLDFSDYVTVNGIQMPSKQKRGRINFLVNPQYDEAVFSRPPLIPEGPKAWKKAR